MTLVLLLAALTAATPSAKAAPPPPDTLDFQFEGTLGDALETLAKVAQLNIVGASQSTTPVKVDLKAVSPADALSALAEAHGLSVKQQGSIYVVQDAKRRGRANNFQVRVGEGSRDRVATQDIVVEANERVDSAVSFGGNVTVRGQVNEDVVSFGGNVEVLGEVDGDVVAFGGNVVLADKAKVHGDSVSFGGSIQKGDDAVVGGEETAFHWWNPQALATSAMTRAHMERSWQDRLGGFLVSFLLLFGLGFVFYAVAPHRMRVMQTEVQERPFRSGIYGLFGAIAMLPISLFLIVSLVGIPLAMALWFLVFVGTLVGLCTIASAVTARISAFSRPERATVGLAVGCALLALLWALPVVGFPAVWMLSLVSFGALLLTRFGTRSAPPEKPIPGPVVPA